MIWWGLLVPSVLWVLFFAGTRFGRNPVHQALSDLGSASLGTIVMAGIALLVFPAFAAVTAFLRFSQSRRHSHAREGNLRLFGAGIAGIVMVVWGILLFVIPGS